MNAQQILELVKKNLVIVILVVVMIAAVVAIPMWSKSKNAAVKEQVDTRYRKVGEISNLAKTTFEDPVTGETTNTVINDALLREYEKVVAATREDAEQVRQRAIEFNRDDHQMIRPPGESENWMFPAPPEQERETRPKQFHELLVRSYRNLLSEINAGTPPDPSVLADELQRKKEQFKLHSLSKTAEQALTDKEQQKLTEELREFRLGRYQEVASMIDIYADFETLNVPQWNQKDMPTPAEAFEWQWQYWIFSDVLRGLSRANVEANSMLQAPVKRLLAISLADAPAVGRGSAGKSGGGGSAMGASGFSAPGPGGALGGGGGTRGRRPGTSAGDTSGSATKPINPNQPVPIDYSISFTGRKTNPLYDVRYVQLCAGHHAGARRSV